MYNRTRKLLRSHTRLSNTAFSPLSILELYLDSGDTSTITETAGAVSQWDDQTDGNPNATQGTASAQPTTGVRTNNSLNALDFDGGDVLTLSTADIGNTRLFCDAGDAFTIFLVCSADAGGTFIARAVSSQSARIFQLFTDGTALSLRLRGGASTVATGLGTSSFLCAFRWNGSTAKFYINGTETICGVGTAADSAIPVLIGARDGGYNLNGAISFVGVADTALDQTDMNNLGNYLADKWGETWTDI